MSVDYQVRYLPFYIIITLTTFIVFTATHYSTIMQARKIKKTHYDLKGQRSHCEHKPCQEPNSRQRTTCLLSAVCKRKGSSSPIELYRQRKPHHSPSSPRYLSVLFTQSFSTLIIFFFYPFPYDALKSIVTVMKSQMNAV